MGGSDNNNTIRNSAQQNSTIRFDIVYLPLQGGVGVLGYLFMEEITDLSILTLAFWAREL